MENKKIFAGFWIRHIAIFVDFVIIMLALFPIMYFINYFGIDNRYESLVGIIVGLFLDLIAFFYFSCFHAHFGQTPGKMIVGVKVVSKDFGKLSHLQSIGRSFATILSSLPLFLGYAWASWDKEKRTFHDMLAKTYVIEENAIGKKWVIFWNLLIIILSLLLIVGIIAVFYYIVQNPEILMKMELENL